MKVPQFTIYAKSAGVEITPYEKRPEGKACEGRISLRFFKMESGALQLRFVVEPWEGFELSRMIDKVFREGGRETLTHKFESSEGEIVSKLSVEKYARNNKAGYALIIQRGNDSINVSACTGHFLYAAEFLKYLSITESWVEQERTKKLETGILIHTIPSPQSPIPSSKIQIKKRLPLSRSPWHARRCS